jgi:predicted small metal-binding protein
MKNRTASVNEAEVMKYTLEAVRNEWKEDRVEEEEEVEEELSGAAPDVHSASSVKETMRFRLQSSASRRYRRTV